MGTYTTNYNLFLPTVGEQGWGTLVNGNFTTIDATMKSLSNRIGTLETETDTLAADIAALEGVSNGGNIKSASITNSGTITSTGLITGNGGFKGNLTGNVTGSATSLNKTVTIGVSSSTMNFEGGGIFMVAPFIAGVTYSGSVKFTGNWGGATLWTWSGSSWSTQNLSGTGNTTQRTDTKTFSNVKCVIMYHGDTNNQAGVLYVPTYS